MPTRPRPFKLTSPDLLEIDRQADIIKYLIAEPRVKFVIRINGGGRFINKAFIWFYKVFIRGYEPIHGKGVSDLIGMLRDGRFFAIECKRPGEKPTPEQTAFLQWVQEAGGAAGIAETWLDAKNILTTE